MFCPGEDAACSAGKNIVLTLDAYPQGKFNDILTMLNLSIKNS
jgi:hypothetical protein